MIEARGLVKHYRSTLAVDSLSFDVRPGTVTGFLGPNGGASRIPDFDTSFVCGSRGLALRVKVGQHGQDAPVAVD